MPDNSNKFCESNDVHIHIPSWINEAYFKKLLKRELTEFRKILNLSIIPASPPGECESYTSLLMRIIIDIEMKGEAKVNMANTQCS